MHYDFELHTMDVRNTLLTKGYSVRASEWASEAVARHLSDPLVRASLNSDPDQDPEEAIGDEWELAEMDEEMDCDVRKLLETTYTLFHQLWWSDIHDSLMEEALEELQRVGLPEDTEIRVGSWVEGGETFLAAWVQSSDGQGSVRLTSAPHI